MLLVVPDGEMLWEETLLFIFCIHWCLFSSFYGSNYGEIQKEMRGTFQCKGEYFLSFSYLKFNSNEFLQEMTMPCPYFKFFIIEY